MTEKTISGIFASIMPLKVKMHDGKSDNKTAFVIYDLFQNIAQQMK